MRMRMSVRRLEALISCAGRGIEEIEADDNVCNYSEVVAEIQAAREALWYLHEWLREMKKVES